MRERWIVVVVLQRGLGRTSGFCGRISAMASLCNSFQCSCLSSSIVDSNYIHVQRYEGLTFTPDVKYIKQAELFGRQNCLNRHNSCLYNAEYLSFYAIYMTFIVLYSANSGIYATLPACADVQFPHSRTLPSILEYLHTFFAFPSSTVFLILPI